MRCIAMFPGVIAVIADGVQILNTRNDLFWVIGPMRYSWYIADMYRKHTQL